MKERKIKKRGERGCETMNDQFLLRWTGEKKRRRYEKEKEKWRRETKTNLRQILNSRYKLEKRRQKIKKNMKTKRNLEFQMLTRKKKIK